ncbi:MAG: VWA domain-containing protein [Paludibacteraceae bacterium]|nr:VWA domain-containing protein [Paludibacteraceae bacterium]
MFRFANPHLLYALALVPLLILLFFYGKYSQRKRLQKFGDPEILRQLMPDFSKSRSYVKFFLQMLALSLLILAAARPQYGVKQETNIREGVEAMIALDVSNSMLAQDVSPNRLENSKLMISKMIDKMADDKVGLVVFAGDAFIQLPITSDNVSAKMFLSNISTNTVPRPGTAIGSAIELCVSSFGSEKSSAGRTIILITDGENHEDNAVEAAKMAAENGVTVNVVGLGKTEGALIPIEGTSNFWRDKDGEVVITKLNEEMCKNIAAAGKGIYVHADNSNSALRAINNQIESMQKGELEVQSYSQYEDHFFIFLWLAMFVLFIEYFVLGRQNHWLRKINLFKEERK